MNFYPISKRKASIIYSFIILSINQVCAQINKPHYIQTNPKEISNQSNFMTQNGSLVYVDFSAASFSIEKIQVFTLTYGLVSYEFVGDLPKSTFYEINLENRGPGAYIIHLVGRKESTKKAINLK